MTYDDLGRTFQERHDQYMATAQRLQTQYNRFSILRLAAFVAGVGASLLLSDVSVWAAVGFAVVFLVGFVRFMLWHQGLARQRQTALTLAQLNANERRYQSLDILDFADGAAFADPQHPYAVDLDCFGKYSLFQYLNRAATQRGQRRFADYLTTGAAPEALPKRQAAAQELAPQLDWRQQLQVVTAAAQDNPEEVDALLRWLAREDAFVSNNRFLQVALRLMPLLMLVAVVSLWWGVPYQVLIVLGAVQMVILRQHVERINEVHRQTEKAVSFLAPYADIIAHIEGATFAAKANTGVQDKLRTQGQAASMSLKRLAYLIGQLNVRYNIFAVLLSATVLWDLQWVDRLERWKAQHRHAVAQWLDAMAEMEALASLGAAHYHHPDWVWPTVVPHETAFAARQIGHPLLHRQKRVCNDLNLAGQGHLKLVTGSNMAGKSTFLRAVGVNIVLAMMGAPVCAKSLTLPQLRVYTSMRTQDALQESTSSFYAELKRLKGIIEAVESRSDVFFLLDEILKGTNSNDRHRGAKALILQLIQGEGRGIVATHDLELGALAEQHPHRIENWCMEVEVLEDALQFDYTLKRGVSQSFNASYLMQNMGIRMDALE